MRSVTLPAGTQDILYGETPFGWRLSADRSAWAGSQEQRLLSVVRHMYLAERMPMRAIVERLRNMRVVNRRGLRLRPEQRVGSDSAPKRAARRGETRNQEAPEGGKASDSPRWLKAIRVAAASSARPRRMWQYTSGRERGLRQSSNSRALGGRGPSFARVTTTARSTAASMPRACSRKTRPGERSVMPLGVRAKRGVPIVLERPNVPADGRLRHAEALRGAAHVALLRHCNEVSNLRQAHAHDREDKVLASQGAHGRR